MLILRITEYPVIIPVRSQDITARYIGTLLPNSRHIATQNPAPSTTGQGFFGLEWGQYYLKGQIMLTSKDLTAGAKTRARTALLVIAATLLVSGTAAEARTRYHHEHHHGAAHHAEQGSTQGSPWRNANAMAPSGRSFTGVASTYGNESGRQTASGQRFNENAMTCAHRSLPFGTKLRVTHGDRSVVVTVNDRGPFVRGRVLDLSTGAARAIGLGGLGQVTAEIVS